MKLGSFKRKLASEKVRTLHIFLETALFTGMLHFFKNDNALLESRSHLLSHQSLVVNRVGSRRHASLIIWRRSYWSSTIVSHSVWVSVLYADVGRQRNHSFSMSHNTNSGTQQRWVIHTVGTFVSVLLHLFSLPTSPCRSHFGSALTWFSTAWFFMWAISQHVNFMLM